MKKIIPFIIMVYIPLILFSQENIKKRYLNARIVQTAAKPVNLKSTSSEKLNSIFDEFRVSAYRTSFPNSKQQELMNFVEIECEGDPEKLASKLKKEASNFLSDIIVRENTIPDYNPSDHLYQATLLEPRDWLWHLLKIKADKAWDLTHGSQDVIIASIDTDFDILHPDLINKINPHYDPYTSLTHSAIGSSHGTHTISFAGAENNGGGQLASIGFNTRLIAYKKQGSPLEEAWNASFVMGADIITYSYSGGTTFYPSDSIIVKAILDNGTIIVRSAGNTQSDHDGNRYPFAHRYDERVIIVTSTGVDDNHNLVHPTSQTNANYPEVDICAPGYDVLGANSTRMYDSLGNIYQSAWPYFGHSFGTSVATPIVAGVCALMKAVNPDLTPAQVKDIIKKTADPISDAHLFPPGTTGAGRINAYCSVYYSTPVNLSGSIGGTYRGYFINVNGADIVNQSVNLLGAEVTINGPFTCELGEELLIQNPGSYICPIQ